MSKLKNAGDFELFTIGIVKDFSFIDISSIFYDITIYESLFDPSISGIITLVDSNDIKKNYNLIGGEEIVIQFATAGNENETTIRGIVYKYSPSEAANNNSAFSIHFYSPELDKNLRTYCLEGYEDTTSNIIKKVFDKTKTRKELIVENTIGIQKYVCSRKRPFDVIDSLANTAVSKFNTFGYVFYEDKDNWNFITLQSLYKQAPISVYYYKESAAFDDVQKRNEESFQAIQEYEILKENSYFDRLLDGQKGTTQSYYDISSKKMVSSTYSMNKDFSRTKSLGRLSLDKESDFNINYTMTIGTDPVNELNSYKNKMALLASDTFSANISVFGDNELTVGKVIEVNLPSKVANSFSDNTFSNNFLITAIKHIINKKCYTQVITINKDAASEL